MARTRRHGSRRHAKKHHSRKHHTRKHHSKKHSSKGYRKGSKSKTMKGRKDFSTKKSSKVFNRRGHYQKHAQGSKKHRRPYRMRGGGDAGHCESCTSADDCKGADYICGEPGGVECAHTSGNVCHRNVSAGISTGNQGQ